MAQNRSNVIVAWLCIGVVALIAYGSLYPFNFKTDVIKVDLWQAFGHLSWARAGRGDRVANVLLYVPLGFCLALWLDGHVRHRAAIIIAVIGGATLSLVIEVAQVFISSRVPSLWDVTFNTCGTMAGAVGGIAWRALSARLPKTIAADAGDSDYLAAFVLLLWLGWRWAPFIPHFSLSKLKYALRPLFFPQITWLAIAHYLVWWLVIAQIVFALSRAQRGVEMLLLLIAAVLVGSLFLFDQAFVPSELIALLLLLPMLVLLHRLWPAWRRIVLLNVFTVFLIFTHLAPFTWSATPADFDAWPFFAWIQAGTPINLSDLLRKLFEFAALAWLFKEVGLSVRIASSLMLALVLLLEIVALWMPGHNGSVTDPLLALGIGLIMRYLNSTSHNRSVTRQRVRTR